MIVQVQQPRARTLRGVRRGLREYQAGTYPVPGWGYGSPAPAALGCGCGCGGSKSRGRRTLRGLGDDLLSMLDSSGALVPSVATSTGSVPIVDYNPSIFVQSGPDDTSLAPPTNVYPVAPGGGTLTSQQLATLAIGTNEGTLPLPSVSPSTLLAAAALPNAPAVVKQAAASYTAANPVSSFLSGSIAGLPTYLLLGGAALALLALGSRRR